MAKCENCGRTVRSNAKFCPHCGMAFDYGYVRDVEYARERGRAQVQAEIDNAIERAHVESTKAEIISDLRRTYRYKSASENELMFMIISIDSRIRDLNDEIEGLSSMRSSMSEPHKFVRRELARILVAAYKRLKKMGGGMPTIDTMYKRNKKYARSEEFWAIIFAVLVLVGALIAVTLGEMFDF